MRPPPRYPADALPASETTAQTTRPRFTIRFRGRHDDAWTLPVRWVWILVYTLRPGLIAF
jgi:hypothetical protein